MSYAKGLLRISRLKSVSTFSPLNNYYANLYYSCSLISTQSTCQSLSKSYTLNDLKIKRRRSTLQQQLGNDDFIEAKKEQDKFLFGSESRLFRETTILSSELCTALEMCGKPNATSIQLKTLPSILSGSDIIIGAETGSGKTLSYLIPLIELCIQRNNQTTEEKKHSRYPQVVIMVPNKELCHQVETMAKEIVVGLNSNGVELQIESATSVASYWSYSAKNCPNILICTPVFLSTFTRGSHFDEDLFYSVRHLVLDEADMLLDGSYLIEVEKILDAFKLARREMIRNGEIKVHESVLQNILVAATLPSYGLRSIEKYIEGRFPNAKQINNEHFHKHHPRISQTFYEVNGKSVLDADRIQLIADAFLGESVQTRQIAKIDFDSENSFDEIESAVTSAAVTRGSGQSATMIFVNTATTCSKLAAALRDLGIECVEFHKLLDSDQKAQELKAFREGNVNLFICTDHASRGLDLPNVRHVIQAEFALNVVQYLHRVGRASRAGALGRATNFVDENSIDLVESILSDGEEKRVSQSFSRRRGFRKKIRKGKSS